MRNFFQNWLEQIPFVDPIQQRQSILLQVLLILLITILIVAAVFSVFALQMVSVVVNLGAALLTGIVLLFLRRGFYQTAVFLITSLILLAMAITLAVEGIQEHSLLLFTLPITLFGLLSAQRWLLLLVIGLCITMVSIAAVSQPDPDPQYNPISTIINFVLIIGLLSVFLERFGATWQQTVLDLQTSQLFYRSLWETSTDAIFIVDQQSNIQYANPTVQNIFGYSPNTLVGQPLSVLQPEQLRQPHEQAIRRYLSTGVRALNWRSIETAGLHQDGHEFPIEVAISPLELGNRQLLVGFVRDISERKRANQALRVSATRLQEAQKIAQLGSWEADFTTGKMVWSDEAYILLGYQPGEVSPEFQAFANRIHPEDQSLVANLTRSKVQELGEYDIQYRVIWPDGQTRFLRGRGKLEVDEQNQTQRLIATIMDITDLKRVEKEVLDLNTALEKRVEERTEQLETAVKELEAFSYSISHDLRAPLRAINGFSRILIEDYRGELTANSQRYLDLIQQNAQQMGQLIDDLLTFSRLGRHSLNLVSFTPTNMVHQIWDEIPHEREGRQIHLAVDDLPVCVADPALLRQVFVNLLENAIKFTARQEVSQIEVGWEADENGRFVYFVRDNGVGFDMQYAHKLFGVFQRLHLAEEYEGTGVGLAIVQRVIHRHNGRVWASATPDQGATFYFTLGENHGA